jgi:hypothetical protein
MIDESFQSAYERFGGVLHNYNLDDINKEAKTLAKTKHFTGEVYHPMNLVTDVSV